MRAFSLFSLLPIAAPSAIQFPQVESRNTAQIDWSGLKLVAISLNSVREAAIRASSHLPPVEQNRFVERVNKRAFRERWLDQARAMSKPRGNALPLSKNVQTGPEIMLSALAEHKSETRMSLARSVRRLAKRAEKAKLSDSKHVLNVAQTAGHTFEDWQPKQSAGTNVMVNIALLGVEPGQIIDSGT